MNRSICKLLFIMISLMILGSCASSLYTSQEEGFFVEEKMVYLNGYDQYIDIRGTDRNNPVLLILHGGPGWTIDSITKELFKDLEYDFTIVNWHQRGAGRSESSDLDQSDMKMEVFINDTVAVINYLRDEFDQDKIVLLGHSWGSLLGFMTAKIHPELIDAYIGVSQVTVTKDMFETSKEAAIEIAKSKGDETSERFLSRVNLSRTNPNWLDDLLRYRDLLTELGGTIYGYSKYTPFLQYYLDDKDYSLIEKIKIWKGLEESARNLYPVMLSNNIQGEVESLEVPCFIIQGKHDMLTRVQHTYQLYKSLNSPIKKYFLFENSAHSPYFEEPEKFMEIMRNEIKPLCLQPLIANNLK